MNKDTYNKLPEDVKSVIEELNADANASIKSAEAFDMMYQSAIKAFLDEGGKMIDWNADEMKKLNKLVEPLWIEWIQEQEAKGVPAGQVVNSFYTGLQSQGIEDPALGYAP
jgi:TRAP-type mannitol/chloroaromatic compound transport system substrate-binding protein